MKKLFGVAFALFIAALCTLAFAAPSITLGWTYSPADVTTFGVVNFSVERKAEACASSALTFVEITQVPSNLRAFVDATGLLPSTTYCYRVAANGTTGKSPYSNLAERTTQGPPPAPTGLAAT